MKDDKSYKNVTTPMDKELHEKMREAASHERVKMREIIERGIDTDLAWRRIRKRFNTPLTMNREDESDTRRSIRHYKIELFESLIQIGIEKLTPSIAGELEACRADLRQVITSKVNQLLNLND